MDFSKLLVETYLIEGIVDQVKLQNPDIAPEIIDRYNDESLPKNDKTHLPWVIKQHKLGNVTPETATHLQPYIASYMKNKDLIGSNINKFDVDGLRDAVKRFHSTAKDISGDKPDGKIIHEDDDIIVKQHKGWEQAAKMGDLPENNPHYKTLNAHARWCISLRGGHNKWYLNNYTEGGKHPVVSIENKHSGRKYALVMNPNETVPEFRDEHDSRPDMAKFISENPTILDTKPGKFLVHHFEDAKDYIDKFHGKSVKNLTGDDITKLYHENDDDRTFQRGLLNHKNVSPELLKHDYEQNKNLNWSKGNFPSLAHKNFPKEIVDDAIKNGASSDLEQMATHAHLDNGQINEIIKNVDRHNDPSMVFHHLINNENAKVSEEHLNKMLPYARGSTVSKEIVKRTKDPEVIHDQIVKRNVNIQDVIDNPHTATKTLVHAFNHNYIDTFKIFDHKNFNQTASDEIVKHHIAENNDDKNIHHLVTSSFGTRTVAINDLINKKKLSKESQHNVLNHFHKNETGKNYVKKFLENPNHGNDLINKAYDMYHGDQSMFENMSHKLNAKNLKDYMDKSYTNKVSASSAGLKHTDFEKHPERFDLFKSYARESSGSKNPTLSSDMVKSLRDNGVFNYKDAAIHPNASNELQKEIASKNKSGALAVLDRATVSRDVGKHILENHFNRNNVSVIRKLINHESSDNNTYSDVIKRMNQSNEFSTEMFKKDLVHELYKNRDKLNNKNYDSLTKMKMDEKTMKGLLTGDRLTSDQLHNLVSNHGEHFMNKWSYIQDARGNSVGSKRIQNDELLDKVLNHPSLRADTLTHMINHSSANTFIDDKNKNYAHRKLQELQGQMTLPIRWKNK